MLIRLTTLGAVRVHTGDTEHPDLPAQRLRFGLLLYLAVERDISREEVLAMFWPERDSARAKHALRQMLYELRHVLGDDWIDVRRDRIMVEAAVDATAFEAAVSDGRVEDALRLYGGPFLLGFSLENRTFEGWADRRRAHLGRMYRRLQREHIARLAAAEEDDAALAAARQWVELDPLEDEAAHTLIERLAVAGQRNAALQYYENYERQLAAELQVEPLEETKALVAEIRSGAVVQRRMPAPRAVRSDAAAAAPPEPAAALLLAPDASRGAQRPGPVARWSGWSVQRRALAAAAVLAALTLIIALLLPPPRPLLPANRPVSVAVLPFADHSSDASLLPLTNELTSTLAHSLAQSERLTIISPNAVVLKRSQGTPEDSLGRMLGADFLVGGSVVRDADDIRVSVELLDGRTGVVVETEIVARPYAESRILVDDVVQGAATFLREVLGTQLEIARGRRNTSSEEAFRLVIAAKTLQSQTITMLRAREFEAVQRDLARADSALERAAAVDPDWAEPLVQRGWALERRAVLARFLDPSRRRALLEEALLMSEQAAQRDSTDPGVHALRGAVLHHLAIARGGPTDTVLAGLARAEVVLRRATELDPLSQTSWRRLADLLFVTERYGEAQVVAERANRLDPFGPEANVLTNLLFATSFEIGEDENAEGWCLQGRRNFEGELPFLYCLFALHAWGDRIHADPALLRRAMESFRQQQQRFQPELLARFESMVASAHARAGQPDSARLILRRLAGVKDDPGLLWMRAAAHAALREDSTAIELLDSYLAQGSWESQRVARARPFWRLQSRHPELTRRAP